MELDYYSTCDRSRFDYMIGSVHYLYVHEVCHPIDHSRAQQLTYIETECGGDRLVFAKDYYNTLVRHMEQNHPDIVGHFDVLTKFGLIDETESAYLRIAHDAIDRILPHVKVFEMNTGAISRKVKNTPYPHVSLLDHIREGGGEIILGADSHACDTVDCYFNECLDILRAHRYDHIVTWEDGGFRRIDI